MSARNAFIECRSCPARIIALVVVEPVLRYLMHVHAQRWRRFLWRWHPRFRGLHAAIERSARRGQSTWNDRRCSWMLEVGVASTDGATGTLLRFLAAIGVAAAWA